MIKIGVIGYGYWGPNLVRNFMAAPGSAVTRVCDLRKERLSSLGKIYPGLKTCTDSAELINDPPDRCSRDCHARLVTLRSGDVGFAGRQTRARGKTTRGQIRSSAQTGRRSRRTKARVAGGPHVRLHACGTEDSRADHFGQLGEIYYYDAVRVNLGLFQHDVSVIWDLAIHDLSIMDMCFHHKPVAMSATGISHVPGQPENVAYITLFFPSAQIAHVHVNWLTPVKVRHTLIGGSEKMILYDDLEPSEKLKVYDKGINVTPGPEDVYKMLVSYRLGDMWAPQLDNTEALQTEARHFIDCIETNKQPETDGAAGLRMVNMIEAAETSLRDRGRLVEIQW